MPSKYSYLYSLSRLRLYAAAAVLASGIGLAFYPAEAQAIADRSDAPSSGSLQQTAPANVPIALHINGARQQFEPSPRLENGITAVPMRPIFEALGAHVFWDEATRTISAFKDKQRVMLTIGRQDAWMNGNKRQLDAVPSIIEGTTMVPLRFVSEALGADVEWLPQSREIHIRTKEPLREEAAAGLGKPADPSRDSTSLTRTLLEYELPDPLPDIEQVTDTPYIFKEKKEWNRFYTKYFRIYYFSHETEVLKMAGEFDAIYEHMLNKFGLQPDGELIPVFFQDEEHYAHENDSDWSSAYWNIQDGMMFVQLESKFSIERVLSTFKHEMTHAMTTRSPDSRLRVPMWFHEAAATYYEMAEPYPNITRHEELYEAYITDTLIPFDQIPHFNINWKIDNAGLIYAQAQSFYAFLVNRIGETELNNLWFVRGELSQVLQQISGASLKELEKEWLVYLEQQYRLDPVYRGIKLFDDGTTYIGEMRHGLENGTGRLYFDERLVYEGQFKNGLFDGYGTYYFEDGDYYKGSLYEGMFHGQGQVFDADGQLLYEGRFENDEFIR